MNVLVIYNIPIVCCTLQVFKLDEICDTEKVESQQQTFLSELIEYTYTQTNTWSVSPAHINALGVFYSISPAPSQNECL